MNAIATAPSTDPCYALNVAALVELDGRTYRVTGALTDTGILCADTIDATSGHLATEAVDYRARRAAAELLRAEGHRVR